MFLPRGLNRLLVPCTGGCERDVSHVRQLRMGSYLAMMRFALLAYRGASGHFQVAEERPNATEWKSN